MSAPLPNVFASILILPADLTAEEKFEIASYLYAAPRKITFGGDTEEQS